ncbi:MAG: NAD(P)/FAD-dependent oxidoreductase [Desulfobacterales bacterium]
MKQKTTDILIVGAGPAGSSAALAAVKKGVDVTVVDRRAVIGVPVRCAEAIPARLLGELNIGKDFVVQSVRGMKTILPVDDVKVSDAPGFIIHRDRFDQALVREAEGAGARFLLSTRAICLEGNDTIVVEGETGRRFSIKARIIIGADGPHSRVARWIGAANPHLIPAVQVRMALVRPLEYTEVYLQPDIVAGYGWLFPKGDEANVGLGMKGGGTSIRKTLDLFVSRMIREGKVKDGAYDTTGGWIPVGPAKKTVSHNILLAGDAAGQTHPITGSGIFSAITCGRFAGKAAARAVLQQDLSLLETYDTAWQDFFGDTLNRAFQRRQYMEEEWARFSEIIKSCWISYRAYYEDFNGTEHAGAAG